MTIHFHGCPITPRSELLTLAGRFFCNSFAAPNDTATCHQIGQGNMLDNGAYSAWSNGKEVDWPGWSEWADEWLRYPTTWCVLPDSVDGGEGANDELLREWGHIGLYTRQGVPVWHLHEPLYRLRRLVTEYDRVCFGSSGAYRDIGTEAWHYRVIEAFNSLQVGRRVPWVHMLRGMSLSGSVYPFASVDSTDVGRNHNRPQNTPLAMVQRWDAKQCPATWTPVHQLALEVVA